MPHTQCQDTLVSAAIAAAAFLLHMAALIVGYFKLSLKIERLSCKQGEKHSQKLQNPGSKEAGRKQEASVMVQAPKDQERGGDDERDSSSGDSDISESSCHSPCQTPRTKADITYTSLVFQDKVRNRDGEPKRKKFPDYINIDPDKAKTEIKPVSLAGCSESTEYAHVSQHT